MRASPSTVRARTGGAGEVSATDGEWDAADGAAGTAAEGPADARDRGGAVGKDELTDQHGSTIKKYQEVSVLSSKYLMVDIKSYIKPQRRPQSLS